MKGTIKSKAEIERLFRKGRRSSSYVMMVLASPSPLGTEERGRCAFIAGKKLGPAPFRNRCKRVLRACAAELGAPWDGYDVAFNARGAVAHMDHGQVLDAMRKQLGKLGVAVK